MKIVKYEQDIDKICREDDPIIFLAGPTVRGNQLHLVSWRLSAINILKEKNYTGTVIIPEFSDKTESDKYRYDLPMWENIGLSFADIIIFWIPRTRELIGLTTNFEFGYWMAKNRSKIIYGRPDDAYRITYTDIMWVEDAKQRGVKCPIYNTLEKTIEASLLKLKEIK